MICASIGKPPGIDAELGSVLGITVEIGVATTGFGTVPWDSVMDKPESFPPAEHTHEGLTGSVAWSDITGKPFESLGESMRVNNTALDVLTTNEIEQDNTLPISSAAVHASIGNIVAILEII